MKKVLIIAAVSGFLVQFEKNNVRLLQEMGYEVHFASNARNQVYQFEENEFEKRKVCFHAIHIEQQPFYFARNKKALQQIIDIIEREKIALIHCHTPMGGALGRLAGRHFSGKEIKVIYTVHGFHFYKGCNRFLYKIFQRIESWLAQYTDAIVTINKEDYEAANKFRMKGQGRVYYMPGTGLDMERYSIAAQPQREKAREALDIREYFLLSVGEIRANKNQMVIVRALGKLKKEGYDMEKITYGMVGDGVQKKKIRKLAKKLNIEDRIRFYGYQKNVRPYICAADAVAFPSVREGLGMAALESLAMGIPVLAAENRGTREYMNPLENGILCPAKDVTKFAQAIKEMISRQLIWNEERQRKRIRESVGRFDKSCSEKVMRKVYEETFR